RRRAAALARTAARRGRRVVIRALAASGHHTEHHENTTSHESARRSHAGSLTELSAALECARLRQARKSLAAAHQETLNKVRRAYSVGFRSYFPPAHGATNT